ncbi:MAG: DUF5606 domain-containing protein [Bacteroidales bacterium]
MLKKILAISGEPGLFKAVGETRNGIVVESLITGKKMPVNASRKVVSLAEVSIYTNEDETSLKEVLKNISKNGGTIDPKSSKKELREFFAKACPDFDQDRVYDNDIAKVIKWYNLLEEKELLNFEEEVEAKAEVETQAKAEKTEAKSDKSESKPKEKSDDKPVKKDAKPKKVETKKTNTRSMSESKPKGKVADKKTVTKGRTKK